MIFLYVILGLVSISLMGVILMQSSKGGGLAGTFGGAASTTNALFGGSGAGNFLTKLTTGLAVAFMVLIILISVLNKGAGRVGGQSLIQQSSSSTNIVPGTQFDAQDLAAPQSQPATGIPGSVPVTPKTDAGN